GIGTQVTSIMMTSGTPLNLNENLLNILNDPKITSLSSKLSGMILGGVDLSGIRRTDILTVPSNDIVQDGNPANGEFDSAGAGGDGVLILPGLASLTFGDLGVFKPITSSSGAGDTLVPGAAVTTVARQIGDASFGNAQTIVFPNPAGAPMTSLGA